MKKKILISTGGSGGHVIPAITFHDHLKEKFDVILILEVLEHLDQWEILLKKIKNNLKKKGVLIISTINQTQLARIFAIYMAENILNWIPKNTHNFQKLIKPNMFLWLKAGYLMWF